MIRPPYLLALAVVIPVFMPAQVTAQPAPAPPPLVDIPGQGSEIFRWLFHLAKIEPLTVAEAQDRIRVGSFQDVIVVVLGFHRTGVLPDHLQWVGRAPEAGGAALVAADKQVDFTATFHSAPGDIAKITGGSVLGMGKDRDWFFMGQPRSPFVESRRPPLGATGPEWELFKGLNRIATSQPSALKVSSRLVEFRSVLAQLPKTCQTTDSGTPFGSRPLDPNEVFAAGGSGLLPRNPSRLGFRFLALSDPNVFLNGMLVPPDTQEPTDNLEFANRVVKFLSEEEVGGKRKRTHCLFIHNGQQVTRFDDLQSFLRPSPPPIPLPNLDWNKLQEKLIDYGNDLIDRVQENDGLNRAALGHDPDVQDQRLRAFLKGLLIVLSGWAVWFIVSKVWSARRVQNHPPPPPAGRTAPVTENIPRNGVFDRRERELLRRNNLFEPVQAVIRDMFAAAGAVPEYWDRDGPSMPPIGISEVVGRPGTLRQALADLWKIGYGRPVVVTVQKWKMLEPLFMRAQQAFVDGKWWFKSVGPKPDPTSGGESGA